jgi:hypothetical protein
MTFLAVWTTRFSPGNWDKTLHRLKPVRADKFLKVAETLVCVDPVA